MANMRAQTSGKSAAWLELAAAVQACTNLAYRHESKGEVEEAAIWLAMARELNNELVGKKES